MKEGRKEGTEAEGNSTPSPYVSLSPSVLLIADFVKALPLTPKMSDDIRSIGPGDESLPPGPSTRRARACPSQVRSCYSGTERECQRSHPGPLAGSLEDDAEHTPAGADPRASQCSRSRGRGRQRGGGGGDQDA